jgi:hypothetical protein
MPADRPIIRSVLVAWLAITAPRTVVSQVLLHERNQVRLRVLGDGSVLRGRGDTVWSTKDGRTIRSTYSRDTVWQSWSYPSGLTAQMTWSILGDTAVLVFRRVSSEVARGKQTVVRARIPLKVLTRIRDSLEIAPRAEIPHKWLP